MADPGFFRGGGANSPRGAPTYNFAKISQKLHEIERIWTPLDPPLLTQNRENTNDPPLVYQGALREKNKNVFRIHLEISFVR